MTASGACIPKRRAVDAGIFSNRLLRQEGALLYQSFKQMTDLNNIFVLSVVIALHFFYTQASSKFGSLKNASRTRENIYMLAVAVVVLLSKTTVRRSQWT